MAKKLCETIVVLVSALALLGCQTSLKNTEPNQSIEESPITLLPETPDSDGDGVLDDIDNCPKTPKNVSVDELGCPMPVDLMDLITMDMRVFFERNSNELQSNYFPELEKVTDKMLNSPDLDLVVVLSGHTSEPEARQLITKTGENLKQKAGGQFQLGRERAQLVKSYLINKGVPNSKIYSFDCADNMQVTPNDTEEGTLMNQRVYGKALPAYDFFNGQGDVQIHSFDTYKTICQQF